jgi:YesN/AraC family two-component response regulator
MGAEAADRAIRVLVVDDTDHVRHMLTSMLELDGFDVVGEAADGPSAIEVVDELDPDVVIIDYKMPAMDGLTMAGIIRERRPSQAMILYTAFIDDEIERRAEEVGVAVCLGKVEGLGSLEREISRLCASL